MDNRIVVIDTETFGLDERTDPILELGFGIYSLPDLSCIAEWSSVVWMDTYAHRRNKEEEEGTFVYKMHQKSELWNDCQDVDFRDVTPFAVETRAVEWLKSQGVNKDDPMAGSSIQFDRLMLREQMPEVEKIFSYRNIDISSFKELCRRINPALYEKLDLLVIPAKTHRVMSDIEDTVNELKFYIDNFLFQED